MKLSLYFVVARIMTGLKKYLININSHKNVASYFPLSIKEVDPRIKIILDIKTPESGEEKKNHWENLDMISLKDEIKFVLCSREDYDWAKKILDQYKLTQKCSILFSPVYQKLDVTDLGDWILKDQLHVRMQIQLHKLLWGEKPGV